MQTLTRMEVGPDTMFEAIHSSIDEAPFNISSTLRQVRLALDTAACQVNSDLKHRPRASSRSPIRRSIPAMSRSYSTGNMREAEACSSRPMTPIQQQSPRASFANKPAQQQQHLHSRPRAILFNNPVMASPVTHCFADYFQARKAGISADVFYRQPISNSNKLDSWYSSQKSRKSPNAPSYYCADPCSPSGLKSVLARLEQVRPATVVLQQMRSASADASLVQIGSGHNTAAGQQQCGASSRSNKHLAVNINPTAAQAYVPGNLKSNTGADLPGLLAPMSEKRPWGGAQSPMQQRPVSPQNMLVLRTLALHTPHNIVPPAPLDRACSPCAGQAQQCLAPRSPQHGHENRCCQTVCGTGVMSVRLHSSPLHHLICNGCNQLHTMQQHQSCCHRCCSCCDCNAAAAEGQQQAPTAETSTAYSDACSCPCIRAYKKGCRDAQKAIPGSAGQTTAAAAADMPRESDLAAGLQDNMVAMQLTDAAVADAIAQATNSAAAAAAATAAAATEIEDAAMSGQTDTLMEVLQKLAAVQEELLDQGPPFDADQLGDVADQLAECVANSQPQHELLLRRVLEQQQQLLAIQQRALLESSSGAGGQAPLLQPPSQQLKHQHLKAWGDLHAPGLPEESNATAEAAADSEAHARTGSWITQHHAQQPQRQGRAEGYPTINAQRAAAIDGMVFEHIYEPETGQGFDTPLPAGLPAGASVSSPKERSALKQDIHYSATNAMFNSLPEEDRLEAAAAAYAAVPETTKPSALRGSYEHASYSRSVSKADWQAGRQPSHAELGSEQQQGANQALTMQELAAAMLGSQGFPAQQQAGSTYLPQQAHYSIRNKSFQVRQEQAGPARSKLPGIEEIESVLAAYDAVGGFADGDKQGRQQQETLMHFMMAPQHASGAVGDSWTGGAELHQGPPQVTAVAQLVHIPSGLSRLSAGAEQSSRPSGALATEGVAVSPSSRSVADSAWSVLATGTNQGARAHGIPVGLAATQACTQQQQEHGKAYRVGTTQQRQQHLQHQQSRSEAATSPSASRFSVPVASDAQFGVSGQQHAASPATATEGGSASQSPGSGVRLHSHGGENDYLETQLSRFSSVRQGVSSPGSNASTPRCNRLADALSGQLSSSGALSSQRLSVRFIEGELPQAAAGAFYPDQPGTARTSKQHQHHMVQQQQVMPHEQAQPQQPAQLCVLQEGQLPQQPQQQQYWTLVAGRAGSFQTPDSNVSSAAASARPSASQMQLQQQLQKHLVAGSPAVAAAVAMLPEPAAAQSRSVSTTSLRQSSTSAGSVIRATAASINVGTSASGSSSPTNPGQRLSTSPNVPSFNKLGAASRASRDINVSGVGLVQPQQQLWQPLELDQLASPVASMPASTRGSFMQHLPSTSGAQQQLAQQQQPQNRVLHTGDKVERGPQLPAEGSRQSYAAAPARLSSTPFPSSGAASDWKQQQVLMQQQLAAQQRQLRQLQSLSSSVVNSPRSSKGPVSCSTTIGRSSVINAAAAEPAAATQACSTNSSPGCSSMVVASNPLFEQAVATAESALVQASGQAAPSKQPQPQGSQTAVSPAHADGHLDHGSIRNIDKFSTRPQHADGRSAAAPTAVEVAAELLEDDEGCNGHDKGQDAQAMLRNVLLEKLLLSRKGRLLQKALSTWWHYTVAVRTWTQEPASSSRCSSGEVGHATGQSAVSLAFTDMQGLQQGVAAAVKRGCSGAEDLDIVISGQVRLQCSPIRRRPPSTGKVGPAVDAVTGGAAGFAKYKSDRMLSGSPDKVAACAKAALAIAAKRSPDRCRSIGLAAAAAAEQAAADAAAEAFAAQAKPLRHALQEVHSMIAEMQNMCMTGASLMSGNASANRPLTHKIAPGVAAAIVRACRDSAEDGRQLRQQMSPTASCTRQQHHLQSQNVPKSTDKYKLQGQLRHVQDRLSKLDIKMNQAAAMHESPCCCSSAADSMSGARSPAKHSPRRSRGQLGAEQQHIEHCGDCRSKCKGGCVRRTAAKRQALVGRMQDEVGQLQQELAQLRLLMPGAYV